MIENEDEKDEQIEPKERGNSVTRYMARYTSSKPQICRVKPHNRILKIMEERGFVEVSEEEFYRIVKLLKEGQK